MTERVIDVVPGLVSGQKRDGRCRYSAQAKAELVRRCSQPGVSVAAMALAHGLNANLLRKWITLAERRGTRRSALLLPVQTRRAPEAAAPGGAASTGHVELVLPGGTIRLCGRVEAATLALAIDCLARRA